MSKFDINATPFTVYTPSDGGIPGEGLNSSERATFRTEMEIPSLTQLSAVETKADDAQSDATQAIADAASANSNANARCLDSEAIKTSGNQTKGGILVFATYPEISVPIAPSGNQVPNTSSVASMISAAVPNKSWSSLTLINGWTGSAKYRVNGDYLEIYISITAPTPITNSIAFVLPSAGTPNYVQKVMHHDDGYFEINSNSNFSVLNVTDGIYFSHHFRMIRLAP